MKILDLRTGIIWHIFVWNCYVIIKDRLVKALLLQGIKTSKGLKTCVCDCDIVESHSLKTKEP